ncbi:hypothetical protein K503DRAFT_743548 [Rhizopogon vinicolor AM-OR11-026]|uniref:Uncharacterized protein n=1 Tax=Rhizopogon vinicolor AM-OR11-026 TaxID=1314800 RepID=A0A1B7MWB6_9AGAM|nr:hypothetical protein K503DRAFT_743548 [Rhizopogon vinicolor AM-OR11-026]
MECLKVRELNIFRPATKSMPFDTSPTINFIASLFAPLRLSSHFDLDVASGIAIFIGGNSAVSALALRPLYGQLWHGWYNTPGCHAIVWELVRTLFQTSFSSEYSERLAVSIGISGRKGPKYIASRSGTVMPQTCYLADMLVHSNWRGKECDPAVVGVRGSPSPTKVTIVDFKKSIPTGNDTLRPRSSRNSSILIIPTATSIVACAFCASMEDWLAFTMILLGMVCSGIASFILSTGKITLGEQLKPARGVPPGDGMLLSDTHIVILRGNEEDVNAVTKGKLRLKLKGGDCTLLLCAFLVSLQVALQLVFMPFASLAGQLMFLLSLLMSGACNLYLSAKEDDIRSNALFTLLNTPEVKTYEARSRASAAVLACLALCWESRTPAKEILQELVPIKPRPWAACSACLAQNIQEQNGEFMYSPELKEMLDEGENNFLTDLIDDVHAAYDRYIKDHPDNTRMRR